MAPLGLAWGNSPGHVALAEGMQLCVVAEGGARRGASRRRGGGRCSFRARWQRQQRGCTSATVEAYVPAAKPDVATGSASAADAATHAPCSASQLQDQQPPDSAASASELAAPPPPLAPAVPP
jgi:hypothetical protein